METSNHERQEYKEKKNNKLIYKLSCLIGAIIVKWDVRIINNTRARYI